MKNIYEITKDFGFEIPEDKKTEFDKAWKENYRLNDGGKMVYHSTEKKLERMV